MPSKLYHIRAEYEGNRYEDFQVGGETLEEARRRAEAELVWRRPLDAPCEKVEWRGQVAFVGRRP